MINWTLFCHCVGPLAFFYDSCDFMTQIHDTVDPNYKTFVALLRHSNMLLAFSYELSGEPWHLRDCWLAPLFVFHVLAMTLIYH